MNTIAMATGMSVDEMNETLNEMGVDVKVETKKVTMPRITKNQRVVEEWQRGASKGEGHYNWTKTVKTTELPDTVTYDETEVAQISAVGGEHDNPIDVTFTGTSGSGAVAGGVSSSSIASDDSGSDSSSDDSSEDTKETKEYKTYDEETERYHVITKQIDSTTRALDKLSAAKEKAWGPQKLALINKEIEANKKYMDQ
jgi:hypothetical protein